MNVRRLIAAAAAVAMIWAGAADAATLRQRTHAARSFAFAIGDGASARDLSRYDLVVVDGATSATRVAQLKRQGVVVLAYLSVGTIESTRWWYRAASPYRLDLWGDWGEWYADTSKAGYRDLIGARVAPGILAKGFDGLFLDNVDMIETHSAQSSGMVALVRTLGKRVHGAGRLLFTQNGQDVIGPLLPVIDGWNREDVTATFEFATGRYRSVSVADTRYATAAIRKLRAAGKVVTATDYMLAANLTARRRAVAVACRNGALPFTSDIGLRRVAVTPLRCF
jgi:uncharacterized protein (TIGR01370 family)